MIVAFDYKSFHVLTLGFEAKDARYMRMARMDMHSFFALAGLLKIEDGGKLEALPDEELKAKLKWYRKQATTFPKYGGMTFNEIRNEKAKRAILGIGFGQQENSLYRLNPDSYASPAEAREVLDALNDLFPKPEKWRWEVRARADQDHKLVSRHGYVRHFWDVFQRKPVAENYQPRRSERVWINRDTGQRWLLTPGDDHESCIAFLPANGAFGIIRERMVEIGEGGLDERFGLNNQIHDALYFDCPPRRVDECLETIAGIMQRPSEKMVDAEVAPGGLWCAVEAKVGKDMARMEEVKVPSPAPAPAALTCA